MVVHRPTHPRSASTPTDQDEVRGGQIGTHPLSTQSFKRFEVSKLSFFNAPGRLYDVRVDAARRRGAMPNSV